MSRNNTLFSALARMACAAALLITAACSSAPTTPMEVAEAAYKALIAERWDDYLALTATGDSLAPAIRQERIDMLREYMATEQRLRGGLITARSLRDTLVDDDYSYVFLELGWGDSTREEVMLPLVRQGEVWKIR